MDPLVRGALVVRGAVRRGHGLGLAVLLGAFVVSGAATAPFGVGQGAACVVWAVLLVSRLRAKLKTTGEAPLRVDVELGALLAVGLDAALLRFEGALDGSLSPALYVLVAVVAAFARPLAGGSSWRGSSCSRRAFAGSRSARTTSAPLAHPRRLRRGLRAPEPRRSSAPRSRASGPRRGREVEARSSDSKKTPGATACSAPARRRGQQSGEGRVARGPPRALERRRDSPVRALRARPLAPVARPAHRRSALAERRGHPPAHQRALHRLR